MQDTLGLTGLQLSPYQVPPEQCFGVLAADLPGEPRGERRLAVDRNSCRR